MSDSHKEMTAEQLEARAAECSRRSQESFERCDTDGFLSQWAGDINAELYRIQAMLTKEGRVREFPALFDLQGRRVRAKVISVESKFHYGRDTVWAFCDENDRFTGKFLKAFPAREATMTRKGFHEGHEMAPAWAKLEGANVCSVRAHIYRTDKGYPDDARVVRMF